MESFKYEFEIKKRNTDRYKLICKLNNNYPERYEDMSLDFCLQKSLRFLENFTLVDKIVFKDGVVIDDIYLHFLVYCNICYLKFHNITATENFKVRFGKYKTNLKIVTSFKNTCDKNHVVNIIKKLTNTYIYNTQNRSEVSVMFYNTFFN